MTNRDLFIFAENLNKLAEKRSSKFAYGLLKTLPRIEKEYSAFNALVFEDDIKMKEVEKQRIGVLKELANKDEKNEAIILDGKYDLTPENLTTFEEKWNVIKEENKELLVKFDEYRNMIQDKLDEESTVEIFKVYLNDLPTDLTAVELESIKWIIRDEE